MAVENRPVILATGGTGGHVFPALAVADELHARNIPVIMTTDRRGQKYITDRPWLRVVALRAGTLRKHPVRFFTDLANFSIGLIQAFDMIRRDRPRAVIGFGGYPCFPAVLAAQMLDLPTIVHDGNAVVGQANRFLARFARHLALSFPNLSGLSERLRSRAVVTGLPVRTRIADLIQAPYTAPAPTGPFHILITGGSQGSRVLGLGLAQILAQLPMPERSRLRLMHQVRSEDIQAVNDIYAAHSITATTQSFITDMPAEMARTHLFIGRAGASTVVEAAIAGRPAIFIPLIASTHKDAQQRDNARVLADVNAAVIVEEPDFTPAVMLPLLTGLINDPTRLTHMSAAARGQAKTHAAHALVDLALALR